MSVLKPYNSRLILTLVHSSSHSSILPVVNVNRRGRRHYKRTGLPRSLMRLPQAPPVAVCSNASFDRLAICCRRFDDSTSDLPPPSCSTVLKHRPRSDGQRAPAAESDWSPFTLHRLIPRHTHTHTPENRDLAAAPRPLSWCQAISSRSLRQ